MQTMVRGLVRVLLLGLLGLGCGPVGTTPTAAELDGPEPSASAFASTGQVIAQPTGKDIAAAASDYVGVREATGRNDGPVVEYFLASVDMRRGVAWCGAFSYASHVEGGVRPPGKAAAYAWSPTWFSTASRLVPVGQCEAGDVMGIYFQSLGRIAHMGIVERRTGDVITTIEGNTNDALSRDGDGVYRKRRKAGTIKATARWW